MCPRPTPTSPLLQSLFVAREIAREAAESAASVCAAAAETCATSKRLVAESKAAREAGRPSPRSPLTPEVLQPIERLTAAMWPGAAVVPSMETGATDGLYLRNAGMPVSGVSGVPTRTTTGPTGGTRGSGSLRSTPVWTT